MYKDKKKEGGGGIRRQLPIKVFMTPIFFLHFLIDNCIYS